MFGDAPAHEADLYEMFDPQLRPPPAAVETGLASAIGRWRHYHSGTDAPPLEIRPLAEACDVWPLLNGRATRELVRGLEWSHDPGCDLDLGLAVPFQFPANA